MRYALAAFVLVLIGCGGADAPVEDDAVRIGAIFALTGATSDVGSMYAEGVRDFVAWTNGRGGIEGKPLELLYQDYGYRVDRAEQLYSEFVQEGVVAFMGWGTGDTEALRTRIADDEIPFMSASYSHVLGDPDEAPYNFLAGTTYSQQFLILLDWILETHAGDEPPKVALLHHASPFGLSPYEQLGRDYAANNGIELTAHEMPRGSTDYTSELARVREWGARYVVFQNTSGPVAVAMANAESLGLEVTFACLNWCANELLFELAGEAAEGVVGAMPFSPPLRDVEGLDAARAFLHERGSSLDEKGVVYGQGWWTIAVMTEGIRSVLRENRELTGANVKVALESIRALDTGGVTSPITFTSEDHRGSKALRLFRIENGTWVPMTDFRRARAE